MSEQTQHATSEQTEKALENLETIAASTGFKDVMPKMPRPNGKKNSPLLQRMDGFYGRLFNWCSKLEHHLHFEQRFDIKIQVIHFRNILKA